MEDELAHNLVDRVAIGDLLRRRARDSAEAIALADYSNEPAQKLTFADLNARANRFGRVLWASGAVQGDLVIVLSPNCTDIAAVMYGCFKTGLIYVPLNFMMSDHDLLYVIDHCAPTCAIIHPSLRERWIGLAARLKSKPVPILMGPEVDSEFASLDALAETVSAEEILSVVIRDRDPVQILYTSGTTSRPKGVVNTWPVAVCRSQEGHGEVGWRECLLDQGRAGAAGASRRDRSGGGGPPHPKWDEAVTAFLTLGPGAELTVAAIQAHCRAHLAKFEAPKDILILEALPATPTGKVQKHELRALFADHYQQNS